MTGMKDQCFGVEVEFTGITRKQAAEALAEYFGTMPRHKGGTYDAWAVRDPEGKEWKLVSDSSIYAEKWNGDSYEVTDSPDYPRRCRNVSGCPGQLRHTSPEN